MTLNSTLLSIEVIVKYVVRVAAFKLSSYSIHIVITCPLDSSVLACSTAFWASLFIVDSVFIDTYVLKIFCLSFYEACVRFNILLEYLKCFIIGANQLIILRAMNND